jgi:hypothetical protein
MSSSWIPSGSWNVSSEIGIPSMAQTSEWAMSSRAREYEYEYESEYDREERLLVIGADLAGNLLELVAVPADAPSRIVHADQLRPKFHDFLR